MPIPDFDHNHVLPPHLGDPTTLSDISPYECTVMELCLHFASSPQRIEILKSFMIFRQRMTVMGILHGFQWLDGSFIEDVEASENRAPNDLDIVTFYRDVTQEGVKAILNDFKEFAYPNLSKANYKLDHYAVDYAYSPEATVAQTRYWYQLFTHNRNSIWKGIIQIPLNTPTLDQEAIDYLNSL